MAWFLKERLAHDGEELRTILCGIWIEQGALAALHRVAQPFEFRVEQLPPAPPCGGVPDPGRATGLVIKVMSEFVDDDIEGVTVVSARTDVLPRQDDATLVPGLSGEHPLLVGDHAMLVVPLLGHDELRRIDEHGAELVIYVGVAAEHQQAGLRGDRELHLADADEVRAAAERIGGAVIVQPMIAGGAELLAGVVQDPLFGPLVAFGPGGVLAELIGEAHFRLAPLTDVDADELVYEGKAGRLVAGFRGAPAADVRALTDVLHRLSRLAEDVPEVAELDLNPIMALPDRAVAVDARIKLARPHVQPQAKTW